MKQTANGNEVLDFDPRKLPAGHLGAIGFMSAAASSTDSIIEMAIAGMLGVDGEQGYAVTAHMSAPLRVSVLKASAEIALTSAAALDELDVVLSRIDTAAKERNRFVHGSWCFRSSDGAVLLVQQEARTHVEIRSRPVAVEEIRSKAAALYEAGMDLMRFMMAVDKLPALPRHDRVRGVNTPKARKAARKQKDNGSR
jgi:hypothetical protein